MLVLLLVLLMVLLPCCLPPSETALATLLPKDASELLMLVARLPAALRMPPAVVRMLALLVLGTVNVVAYAMAGWELALGSGVLLGVAVVVLLWTPAGELPSCWPVSLVLAVAGPLAPAALLSVAGVVVGVVLLLVVARPELLLSVGVGAGPGASLLHSLPSSPWLDLQAARR